MALGHSTVPSTRVRPGRSYFWAWQAFFSPCFCCNGNHSSAVLAPGQHSISGAVNLHGRSDTYGSVPIFCGSLLLNPSCLGRVQYCTGMLTTRYPRLLLVHICHLHSSPTQLEHRLSMIDARGVTEYRFADRTDTAEY